MTAATIETSTLAVGSPVLVVGQLCSVHSCVGLFGYVRETYTPEKNGGKGPALLLSLLTLPTLDTKEDRAREARGDFKTWSAMAKPEDVRPLTDPKALARVEKLRTKEEEEERNRKPDPKFDALLAEMQTPENREAERLEREQVAAEIERLGNVFPMPGHVERGDKSQFPSYYHPTAREYESELMGYAARDFEGKTARKACTLTEHGA